MFRQLFKMTLESSDGVGWRAVTLYSLPCSV